LLQHDIKPVSEGLTQLPGSAALIPAAGLGKRLGLGPKCLLRIGERTLLDILLTTLAPLVEKILVAAPPGFEDEVATILQERATLVAGGATRQASIDNMLAACAAEIVLIQDAARPFPSRALCTAVLEGAAQHGAAGAFLDPTVPVGQLANGKVASYQSRQEARIFQAPQAFSRELLASARTKTDGKEFQSTAQMVIDAGDSLLAIPGEPENIKITTTLDWQIAQDVIGPNQGLVS
jgi:2-C-methyl-D-erythritol 4-phosphate cytidylyltransferase